MLFKVEVSFNIIVEVDKGKYEWSLNENMQ